MFERLGAAGVGGLVLLLAGLAVIAVDSLVVAAGMALMLIGLGLVVKGFASNLMRQFGFA